MNAKYSGDYCPPPSIFLEVNWNWL